MDLDANGIRYMPADYVPSARFKGKNAIVTAGTLGIGRAIVQRYLVLLLAPTAL